MKIRKALFFTGLVSLGHLSAAVTDAPAPPAETPPAKDLAQLIRELSDEKYKTRESATVEIWKMAEKALSTLEEAAKSSDPEQAFRARELLQRIRLHITPDTDPSVITLVEQYLKSTSNGEKSNLFDKLRTKRAWLQMLKLYAKESDDELKLKLRPSMSGIAVRAAREKLIAGDIKSAREFLELAPEDSLGLLALAEFYRGQGLLQAELERAKSLDGRKGRALYLALLRSAGDLKTAREVAAELGETEISSSLAALSGDPVPWLKSRTANEPLVAAYHFAAIARWNSGKLRPSDIAPLVEGLSTKDPSERDAAINGLFLLGEDQAAMGAYIKSEPLLAFVDLESQERIPEALAALGFDPQHPDYKPWVEKRFNHLSNQEIEDQHEVANDDTELVTLASFLERRGQAEDAFALFSGPAAAMAEKDSDGFLSFLGSLVGTSKSQDGAPLLAKRLGQAWAGEDPVRWEELVSSLLGENDITSDWWDWLAQLDPAATRSQRLDAMLALFDVGKDPGKLRDEWLQRAWKQIKDAPGPTADRVSLIATLATVCGDGRSLLKAWDLLPQEKRSDLNYFPHVVCLTNEGRWGDAADIFLKQIDDLAASKQDAGADLHAYAASTLRKAGREAQAAMHEGWVNRLFLGDARLAVQIGHGYAFGCDYKRANEWWERAAMLANPDSPEFLQAITLILDGWMENGRWSESASICEMLCAIYASGEYQLRHLPMLRQRVQGDTARALATLQSNRERSLAMLGKCHALFLTDGSLADFFFPSLRRAGLMKEHDEWFEATWRQVDQMARRYPDSDNTSNTAAWLAARAMRHLDDAERLLAGAIAQRPRQPAYLDTMAELQFSKGNRPKAIEWSKSAVNYAPVGDRESEYMVLRRQLERFQSDPLPKS